MLEDFTSGWKGDVKARPLSGECFVLARGLRQRKLRRDLGQVGPARLASKHIQAENGGDWLKTSTDEHGFMRRL